MIEPQKPALHDTASRTQLSQRSGVSVALVCVFVAAAVANVSMTLSIKSDVALGRRDVEYVARDVRELTQAVSKLTDETRADLRSLRTEIVVLRSRVQDLEK